MLTAIALTLATKAAEGLAEGGKATLATLARLVQRRFAQRASARAALAEAEADPADSTRIETLHQAL
jgi:hypothetical protein